MLFHLLILINPTKRQSSSPKESTGALAFFAFFDGPPVFAAASASSGASSTSAISLFSRIPAGRSRAGGTDGRTDGGRVLLFGAGRT
jgi:hypothetical protein